MKQSYKLIGAFWDKKRHESANINSCSFDPAIQHFSYDKNLFDQEKIRQYINCVERAN